MAGNVTVTGGDHWKKALEALTKSGEVLRVGVQPGAVNDYGDAVAPYAFFNEFGALGVPKRSFMKSTLDEQRTKWASGFANYFRGGNATKPGTVKRALTGLGEQMVTDIHNKIEHGPFQPNSPATLAKKNAGGDKGRMRPLIDTSSLYKAIEWRLDSEGA